LQGDVAGVVTGMRGWRRSVASKEAAQRNETVCNYLENNAERMRYHEYLQAGYPIASGVIEGAAGTSSKSMEQGGMRWTLPGRGDAQRPGRCAPANGPRSTAGDNRKTENNPSEP